MLPCIVLTLHWVLCLPVTSRPSFPPALTPVHPPSKSKESPKFILQFPERPVHDLSCFSDYSTLPDPSLSWPLTVSSPNTHLLPISCKDKKYFLPSKVTCPCLGKAYPDIPSVCPQYWTAEAAVHNRIGVNPSAFMSLPCTGSFWRTESRFLSLFTSSI